MKNAVAQICCYKNQLPQGAPTSPIISNMICAKLDSQLQRLAKKYQCIYTRYADDITFSTSRSRFPSHLVWFSKESEQLFVGDELRAIIEGNGFLVNESKVRLQSRYKRQEVTGITVNEKLNVNRKDIRQIRAALHAWEKYGLENAEAEYWRRFNNKHRFHMDSDGFRSIIRGRIEFIGAVRGKNDQIYLNFLKWLQRLAPDLVSDSKLNLLTSQNLLSEQKKGLIIPIVWSEGKTDLKHLKSALRWLSRNGITYEFKLEFKEDLDEQKQGSSELLKMCEQFCKEKHIQPIIAIFDRDEPDFVKKAHDDAKGFKDWKNGVYSFALPIPRHRPDVGGICVELYYKDEELQRKDSDGRRLFLSSEFSSRSGRHQELDFITDRNKIKNNQLRIISDNVFDKNDNNVALSKDDFANYIFESVIGFDNFDFEEFKEIFNIIANILKHHTEILEINLP